MPRDSFETQKKKTGDGSGGQERLDESEVMRPFLKMTGLFSKADNEKRQVSGKRNGNCLLKATWNRGCARL